MAISQEAGKLISVGINTTGTNLSKYAKEWQEYFGPIPQVPLHIEFTEGVDNGYPSVRGFVYKILHYGDRNKDWTVRMKNLNKIFEYDYEAWAVRNAKHLVDQIQQYQMKLSPKPLSYDAVFAGVERVTIVVPLLNDASEFSVAWSKKATEYITLLTSGANVWAVFVPEVVSSEKETIALMSKMRADMVLRSTVSDLTHQNVVGFSYTRGWDLDPWGGPKLTLEEQLSRAAAASAAFNSAKSATKVTDGPTMSILERLRRRMAEAPEIKTSKGSQPPTLEDLQREAEKAGDDAVLASRLLWGIDALNASRGREGRFGQYSEDLRRRLLQLGPGPRYP